MADIFDDIDSLFEEFDKDREKQSIFIHFEQDESGSENRSRIVFRAAASDSESSDVEDVESETGKQQVRPDGHTASSNEGLQSADSGKVAAGSGKELKQETKEETEGSGRQKQSTAPQTTSYQEQFEKNKYRQVARIIDSTRCVSDEQSPGVQIVFQNNKFAKKYRSRIEQFIISLTEHAEKKDFTKAATDLSTRPITVPTCVDINDKLPPEKHNKRMSQAHGIIGCAQFHNGFMVDSRGWPHDDDPKEYGSGIPKYCQVFDEAFPSDQTSVPQKPSKPNKSACFNCGGDHRLNECKIPKDQNRIRASRREHQAKASSSNPGRYHEDPELDPKKVRFEAGVISEGLRGALGLKSDQLPSYIYRMRLFGYPPGWLLEANRKVSTLAMYDKDGRETNLRGESLEDGEYGEQSASDTAETFDLNKIIEYPGFTVPVPLGFVDESSNMGMPPIQKHQLKKTLIEDVLSKESRKRRTEDDDTDKKKKLKTGEEIEEGETTGGAGEDSEEGASTSAVAEGEAARKEEGERKEEEEEGEERQASPSMDTLQEEYQNLVQQLDSEGGAGNPSDPSSVTNGSSSDSTGPVADTPGSAEKASEEAELLRAKNFTFSSPSTSISKDYGTPILVREKSFQVLPSPDKFGQGIEEHIPYENLPNAVGTFDKMKTLFSIIHKKVRSLRK